MNPLWHDWNPTVTRATPQLLDATLSEVGLDNSLPRPTHEQVLEWLTRGHELGLDTHELLTLKDTRDVVAAARLLDFLIDSGRRKGLVFSLRQGCPWPSALLRSAQDAEVEFRWIPRPVAAGDPDLTTCRRLRSEGCAVSLVIPNANEQDPIRLSRWLHCAEECGVEIVEIAAQGGAPWRAGIQSLLQFVQGMLQTPRLAWSSDHGFGLALNQALEAWNCGVSRLRASLYGSGPQGSVPLELLLVNLELETGFSVRLASLSALCKFAEDSFDLEIPHDYPVFGCDAFRTATGVHAAAIVKARALGRADISDLVYSSVPAGKLGLRQKIEVGPMSGKANLSDWLDRHALEHNPRLLERLLEQVKQRYQILTDLELIDLYQDERISLC